MTRLRTHSHGLGARRRVLTASLLGVALASLVPSLPARADVIGLGDVLPRKEDLPDNPGTFIPDLPIGGGTVTANGGNIVVGGTGLQVGGTDTGQLIIDIPAFTAPLRSTNGVIGGTAEGSGLVQIFTVGSLWQITTKLTVAQFGQGTLELTNGGQLSENPNNPATPILDVVVGEELGSQGFVNLTGSGSLLRSRDLTIGEDGFGQMSLRTRARVTTMEDAIIGFENTGSRIGTGNVTVDGQLSRWTIGATANLGSGAGDLIVGDRGRGALTITNQGEVRVSSPTDTGATLIIGNVANSYGEVTVDGLFSQLWSFGTITVGNVDNARGVLRVRNGGLVRANQAINIGVDGVLEVSGGTILTPAAFAVNNSGTIQTAVGSIGQIDSIVNNQATGEIRNAGTVDRVREKLIFTKQVNNAAGGLITSIGGEMEFTAAVTNSPASGLIPAGLIAGRDAIFRFRDPFTNAGTLAFSVGDSDVYGNVINNGVVGIAHDTNVTFYDRFTGSGLLDVQPGGAGIFLAPFSLDAASTVNIALNSVADVDEIGQLQILSTATLGGALNVSGLSGLNPDPGDSFQLITATSLTGTFSSINLPPGWTPISTPTSFSIIFSGGSGPFNANFKGFGVVDGADLAIWRANFGLSPATQMQGDANGDNRVDGDDFLIWQRHQGLPQVVPTASPVPEPGSVTMMLSALALAAGVRRRLPKRRPVV